MGKVPLDFFIVTVYLNRQLIQVVFFFYLFYIASGELLNVTLAAIIMAA